MASGTGRYCEEVVSSDWFPKHTRLQTFRFVDVSNEDGAREEEDLVDVDTQFRYFTVRNVAGRKNVCIASIIYTNDFSVTYAHDGVWRCTNEDCSEVGMVHYSKQHWYKMGEYAVSEKAIIEYRKNMRRYD
jgi:hypothetical protein